MPETASHSPNLLTPQLSVLVVDDHLLMRRLVTQQMKTIGFQVIENAIHGQEAWKKLEEAERMGHCYDIVMLDWGMPIMNGFDLLKKCRSDHRFDHIAFVMLTGECEQKNVMEALQDRDAVSGIARGNAARLLDKTESKFTLEGLGMSGDVLAKFDKLVQQPHGIVLVTGPTGSGKTTTLYASLGRVDTATTNVLTVEDPVEYELAGIGQTQVNPKIDLTFAKALRGG